MKINGTNWRTIWLQQDGNSIGVIDQRKLPHQFICKAIYNYEEAAEAIQNMSVRGAPLIGVTGAYGLMLALQEDASDKNLEKAFEKLISTRPTAINLSWALNRVKAIVKPLPPKLRANAAKKEAQLIAEEDVTMCKRIGEKGYEILNQLSRKRDLSERDKPINILTHCNAGWLATVDWGTALAPIYQAHRAGLKVHVWVDETRPRNQGASLTSYELGCEGIPYTVIVDNAGGHLMQNGQVDVVIVGSDRTTSRGDVCNKIGTYLKALAANDNSVPFYVALPSSTIDWSIVNGLKEIPIETRSELEVLQLQGQLENGEVQTVKLCPPSSKGFNPAFDVTPSRLITGLITERGVISPNYKNLKKAFSE
tara:strand:- start:14173 stop:15270 length:1098 start_codon:yes stop_codon:yes gene_type:complete